MGEMQFTSTALALFSVLVSSRAKHPIYPESVPPFKMPHFELSPTSAPLQLTSLCGNLTFDAFMSAAMHSEGSKRRFFPKLREITQTPLTAQPFITSGIKLVTSVQNALFIGDSIMGEISKSYANIVGADAMSFVGLKDTGLNASGVDEYKVRLESAYSRRPFDVAFVGGLGLHHLLRKKNSLTDTGGDLSLKHKDVVKQYADMFGRISVGLGVPVIFVGVPTLDGATILMSAAKHDFNEFYDFSIPVLWDATESRLFHVERSRLGAGILHMRLAELTNACPGVRCDGMHFASFGRECEPSSALWDHFLGEFLLKNFG